MPPETLSNSLWSGDHETNVSSRWKKKSLTASYGARM